MPEVRRAESQKAYVSRAIPMIMREHKGMKSDQAAAIAYSMYRRRGKRNAHGTEKPVMHKTLAAMRGK